MGTCSARAPAPRRAERERDPAAAIPGLLVNMPCLTTAQMVTLFIGFSFGRFFQQIAEVKSCSS